MTNNNDPARLLLNAVPARGHWLMVQQVRRLGVGCESWNQMAMDRVATLREGSGQLCGR